MTRLYIIGKHFSSIILLFAMLLLTLCIFNSCNEKDLETIPYQVMSASMEPTFQIDEIIYFRPVDVKTLQVGDIICYYTDYNDDGIVEIVAHRIVEVCDSDGSFYFRTQGDNQYTNSLPDKNPVYPDDIIGKYFSRSSDPIN